MVSLAVAKLGQSRPTCFALPLLFAASRDIDRGHATSAGCKLLAATRRYVLALCEAHDVTPARSLRRVVRQLLAADCVDEGCAGWLTEIIDAGEACQQCRYVDPSLIETGISLLTLMLNHSPELVLPTREGGAV